MKRREEEEEEKVVEEEEEINQSKTERSIYFDGGEWVRGRLLGRGSFGDVHEAFFPNPKKAKFSDMPAVAAVKSARMPLSAELMWERKILKTFQDCPHIIRCLGNDITCTDRGHFKVNLFLELASGGALFDLVARSNGSGLPEAHVRQFTKSILGGLQRIHEEGFVHCDIKLENVLLVKQGTGFVAKVADFGLAHRMEQRKERRVRGTALYLAPEAVREGTQGPPADVWAVGCVVLAMLTGRLPWDDRVTLPEKELRRVIATESPVIPCGVFSESADDFMFKCFRRDPERRPTAAMLLGHPFVFGAGAGAGAGDYNFGFESYRCRDDCDSDDEDYGDGIKFLRFFAKPRHLVFIFVVLFYLILAYICTGYFGGLEAIQ